MKMSSCFGICVLITIFCSGFVYAQNYNPINYNFNGTPANGVKIKTNLPFTNGSQMPTIIIEGYNYGKSASIGLILNWYIYNGEFIGVNASSHGAYAPDIKLANENGKVVIFLASRNYFNRFTIRTFGQGLTAEDTPAFYERWTVVDEALTGSYFVDVPYNTWVSQENADVTFIEGKRVGIGTSNPSMKLELGNLGTNDGVKFGSIFNMRTSSLVGSNHFVMEKIVPTGDLYIRSQIGTTGNSNLILNDVGGDVGIGTITPRANLDIGRIGASGTLNAVLARLSEGNNQGDGTFLGIRSYKTQGDANTIKSFALEHSFYGETNSSLNFYRGFDVTGGFMTFNTSANIERMRINQYGNVGIGTVDPDGWKLAVNGSIRAKEIKVETGWSDFVFEDDYKLPTLKEVEQHIEDKGHLQDIPSAADVAENGIFLGEMDSKLLQKIEELMLYTIEQQKEIKVLQEKVLSLESRIDE